MASIEKRPGKKGVSWRAVVTVKGYPSQKKTYRRRADAVEWATKTEGSLRDGHALPGRRERDRTVADLIAEYRATTLAAYSTVEQQKRGAKLAWWDAELGRRRLVELKAPDFSECLRRLAAGAGPTGERVGPATQVRYLATIRHAFSTACKDWGWLDHNPAAHVRTPKEPRGRDRYLSAEERQRLVRACRESEDRRLYPLVILALSTGGRQGELLALRWADVDLAREQATVDGKNGERRALALSEQAVAVLRGMRQVRHLHSELVFATSTGRAPFPRDPWEAAVQAAKIERFRFHDLRHTFASYLAMTGATLPELAAALGHKTLAMVQRYAHLAPAHTAGVVRRMTEKFLS